MTIHLPAEQNHLLDRLVKQGKFATAEDAVVEAVRRLETEEALDYLNPTPLSNDEAERVYAANAEWETIEQSMAGRVRPEA